MKALLNYRHSTGIALFQVLLMTAIFSTLLLLMIANVQQHQRQVQRILQSTEQQLILYSASNTLIFTLLTEEWLGPDSGEDRYGWNFYGYKFDWQHNAINQSADKSVAAEQVIIDAQLQDVNGLLDLRLPDEKLFRWFTLDGVSSIGAVNVLNALRDSQKLETAARLPFIAPGLFFQHVSEVIPLPGWAPYANSKLLALSRVHGDDFNFNTAPDEILAALLPPAQFDILRQWRQQGPVSVYQTMELTGIEPETGVSFFPGQELIMTLRIGLQYRRLHMRLDSSSGNPVLIRQQTRS